MALAALPTIQPRTGIEAKVRQLDADGSLTSRGSRLRAQAAPFGGAAGEHDGSCERRAQAGGSRIGGMTGAHSEVRAEPAAPRAGNTRGLQGVGVARLGDGQPPTMRELGGEPRNPLSPAVLLRRVEGRAARHLPLPSLEGRPVRTVRPRGVGDQDVHLVASGGHPAGGAGQARTARASGTVAAAMATVRDGCRSAPFIPMPALDLKQSLSGSPTRLRKSAVRGASSLPGASWRGKYTTPVGPNVSSSSSGVTAKLMRRTLPSRGHRSSRRPSGRGPALPQLAYPKRTRVPAAHASETDPSTPPLAAPEWFRTAM